jgi:GH24 family phage-related lysozyme (muramidase)
MNKTILDRYLVERLKKFEGYSREAFWDNKQYSIGYGTEALFPEEVLPPGQKGKDEAEKRLLSHLYGVRHNIDRMFGGIDTLTPARRDSLIDMLYNLGLPTFKKFKKMIAALTEDKINWYKVASEAYDSKWRRQVGRRAIRICNELATGEYFIKE